MKSDTINILFKTGLVLIAASLVLMPLTHYSLYALITLIIGLMIVIGLVISMSGIGIKNL